MNKKALVLLSGGLDSILACRVMIEQGIEVEAINFVTSFCTCTSKNSCKSAGRKAAEDLGVKLSIMNVAKEYLEIVKSPKHGYGSNMNPCIDCRIFMFKKAKEHMAAIGASFVVTGEVLGERPMSQRRDAMNLIEKESGLKGLIVRPLSAKLMDPTIPEQRGVVDREKLLDISGRSRQPQMALADKFNIKDYPCPGGGCLLTDPGFGARIKDMLEHGPFDIPNINLLKVGRHFRFSPQVKAIVGRDHLENAKLEGMLKEGDITIRTEGVPGPMTLLRGGSDSEFVGEAGAITARYTKARSKKKARISYTKWPDQEKMFMYVTPAEESYLEDIRI